MRIVRPLITWAIVLAIAFVAYKYVYPLFKPVKEEMDVQTAEVTKGDLRITVPCDGTVVPRVLVEVKTKASGVVEKIEVEAGDIVKQGQVICELDRKDIEKQLEQAQASLDASKANFALTKRSLSPQQREQAESGVRAAQISYDAALASFERIKKLYEKSFATEDEMTKAQTQLDSAKESLKQAKKQLELDLQGAQPEEIEVARTNVVRSQAEVDRIQEELDYTTVRAPQSGTVLTRPVEIGTAVASGTSGMSGGTVVCTIGDLSTLYVKAYIDETDLGKVTVGAPCRLAFDAFQGWVWHGTVKKIYPQGEIATGGGETGSASFQIDIELNLSSAEQDGSAARASARSGGRGGPGGPPPPGGGRPPGAGTGAATSNASPQAKAAAEAAKRLKVAPMLRPQQSASVDVVLDDHPGVLMIPSQYVKYENNKPYCFVLPNPKDQAVKERRELELGFTDGVRYEIKSGLKEGETVLLERPIKTDAKRPN
jgi:multidrug efflux pump subunit AcrA (membrane-fusion protein)